MKLSRNSKLIFLLLIIIISALFYLIFRKECNIEGLEDEPNTILLWAMKNYPNETYELLNVTDIRRYIKEGFMQNRDMIIPENNVTDFLFAKFLIWKDSSISSAVNEDGTLNETYDSLTTFFDNQPDALPQPPNKVLYWVMTNYPEKISKILNHQIFIDAFMSRKLIKTNDDNMNKIFTTFLILQEPHILNNTVNIDGTIQTKKNSIKYLKNYLNKIYDSAHI